MEVNGRIHKFLSYIGEPVSNEYVSNFYVINDIKHERIQLYKDFTISLMILVFNTYLGDDVTNPHQQLKHFDWCWNKNISNFKEEGIDLNNKDLYQYFKLFTVDIFYTVKNKGDDALIDNIKLLWEILFTFESKKTEPDLEMLLKIYNLFTKSLEK